MTWTRTMELAEEAVKIARSTIDELSQHPETTDELDMLICFAGNTLEGSLALLRDVQRARRAMTSVSQRVRGRSARGRR